MPLDLIIGQDLLKIRMETSQHFHTQSCPSLSPNVDVNFRPHWNQWWKRAF